jgi:catechol 2,3-dioxygenase-like lactoylglutathione lyase family enzyme
MIDHVSVPVRDLKRAAAFYDAVLATLGYTKLDDRPATVGFGKKYSEFWINLRPDTPHVADPGTHVALRAGARMRSMPSTRRRLRMAADRTARRVRAERRAKAITPLSCAIPTATGSKQ